MTAQQGLRCKGLLASAAALGRIELAQRDQFSPGHHPFHCIEEFALARALDGVAQAQAALLHGRIVWASGVSQAHHDGIGADRPELGLTE